MTDPPPDWSARLAALLRPAATLERHALAPRKSWGQHFLHERLVLAEIVRASGAGPGRHVVEIGAGLGTLTAGLLATGAEVEAIERDRDLCAVLRRELGEHPRLTVHEADAVRFDYGQWVAAGRPPPTVVGNLPYQLTGPLLFALLGFGDQTGPWIVMVQREVAARLLASPGTKQYGGITVALARTRTIDRVVEAPRGCFLPPPRVDSTVLKLAPRPAPLGPPVDPSGLLALIRACFQQRRKQLANALTPLAGERAQAEAWCAQAEVDPRARAERLGPVEFARLQQARERAAATAARDDPARG